MNTLRIKTKISCNTCCCTLPRTKAIKVEATTKEEAQLEAALKVMAWKQSLQGQNCKICAIIIREMAA